MAKKQQAEDAVKTLITWAGDNLEREGLADTPKRVVEAYQEFFVGYTQDPHDILSQSFSEVEGYQNIVLVEDIPFYSHCEHHMIPFFGKASIAYLPNQRIVGFSRLIRVLEVYSRRLQVQERLTEQVAQVIQEVLQPKGVAVFLQAEHLCMSMRGIRQSGVHVKTHSFCGTFTEPEQQERFFRMLSQ